jgi:hypothetical protein
MLKSLSEQRQLIPVYDNVQFSAILRKTDHQIASPIQEMLTQILESDHVEHIFPNHMLRFSNPKQ